MRITSIFHSDGLYRIAKEDLQREMEMLREDLGETNNDAD
jgi:hypothetical protein